MTVCATTPRHRILGGAAVVLSSLVTACGGAESGPGPVEWRAQVDTLGDTIVVRTLEGSEWGPAELVPEMRMGVVEGEDHEMLGQVTGLTVSPDGDIYLYDSQVPALRKYDAGGKYIGTFGGEGSGPGEYRSSDGGLAVLEDGRVVLSDPGNGRFVVYGPDGEHLDSWRTGGQAFTSFPLFRLRTGGFLGHDFTQSTTGLIRYASDGTAVDTLPLPEREVASGSLSVESPNGAMAMTRSVPFMPSALWTVHPDGYFLSGVGNRYAVDLLREDGGVLRLARDVAPVPVTAPEQAAAEERISRDMRQLDPSWSWEGPPIPPVKPFFRSLRAGEDGRIWVQLHQPGERVETEEEAEPGTDGEAPIPEFREPVAYDVFEPDGRYLGRVQAPEGFQTGPSPVMRGEHVWAIERDELDVQYLVRYRVERDAR